MRLKELVAETDRCPCLRQSKLGIQCDRLGVESIERGVVFGGRNISIFLEIESAEIGDVGLRIARRFRSETCLFFRSEFCLESSWRSRWRVRPAAQANRRWCDRNAPPRSWRSLRASINCTLTSTRLSIAAHRRLPAHVRRRAHERSRANYALRPAAVLHHRGATDHFQITDLRQARQHIVLDAIGEEGVFLVLAQILQRQDRDRFFRRPWEPRSADAGANNSLGPRRRWRRGPGRAPLCAAVGDAGALPPSPPGKFQLSQKRPRRLRPLRGIGRERAAQKPNHKRWELSARPIVQPADRRREVGSPRSAHTRASPLTNKCPSGCPISARPTAIVPGWQSRACPQIRSESAS